MLSGQLAQVTGEGESTVCRDFSAMASKFPHFVALRPSTVPSWCYSGGGTSGKKEKGERAKLIPYICNSKILISQFKPNWVTTLDVTKGSKAKRFNSPQQGGQPLCFWCMLILVINSVFICGYILGSEFNVSLTRSRESSRWPSDPYRKKDQDSLHRQHRALIEKHAKANRKAC